MNTKITTILLLLYFISFAQNKETKGYVYYTEYKSINWGARNAPPERGNLIFDFTKQESLYYTGKDSLNSSFERDDDLNSNELYEGKAIYNKGFEAENCLQKIFTSNDSMKNYFKWGSNRYGNNHYYKEKKPSLNWQLEKETKTIGNYICYKANCFFRGRKYIAWYTLDIPVPYGPWKLNGLPGLILEAYTPNEEIYYCARKIIYPFNFSMPIPKIELEKNNKWMTTIPELLRRQEDLVQDAYEESVLIIASMQNSKAKAIKNSPIDVFREITE